MTHRPSQMPYALKDGKVVHIDDVEKGIKCGCTCPSCGELLVARKGAVRQHHFAHANGGECATGYQTAVHLRAKDLFLGMKYLYLPKYKISVNGRETFVPSMNAKIKEVVLEKRLGDIIPDIIVTTEKGQQVLVEIFVTHKVDKDKAEKIKNMDIPAIEISLDNSEFITDKILKKALTKDIDYYGKWVYFGKDDFFKKKLLQHAELIPIENHSVCCPVLKEISLDNKEEIFTTPREICQRPCEFFWGMNYNKGTSCAICTGKQYISDLYSLKSPYIQRKHQFLSNSQGVLWTQIWEGQIQARNRRRQEKIRIREKAIRDKNLCLCKGLIPRKCYSVGNGNRITECCGAFQGSNPHSFIEESLCKQCPRHILKSEVAEHFFSAKWNPFAKEFIEANHFCYDIEDSSLATTALYRKTKRLPEDDIRFALMYKRMQYQNVIHSGDACSFFVRA